MARYNTFFLEDRLRIPRGRMIEYSKTEQIQIEMESLGIVETQECTA